MRKKQLIIVLVTLLVVMVAGILITNYRKNRFSIVSITPENGKILPTDGAIKVVVSHAITNTQEIVEKTTIEPSSKFHILVVDKTVTFVPDTTTKEGELNVTIPSIQSNNGRVDNISLNFTVEEVREGRNESERESKEAAIVDSDEIITRKYPFLADLVTSKPDFDIDYEYDGFNLTIRVNLHPASNPPLYNVPAYEAEHEKAYAQAQDHIRNSGADLSPYSVVYTPKFMDNKYGRRVAPDEGTEAGDGGAPVAPL